MIVVLAWLVITYYTMAIHMWTDVRYILWYIIIPMLLA